MTAACIRNFVRIFLFCVFARCCMDSREVKLNYSLMKLKSIKSELKLIKTRLYYSTSFPNCGVFVHSFICVYFLCKRAKI